jgi:drug/metabolite transporter (DMT)-like permease
MRVGPVLQGAAGIAVLTVMDAIIKAVSARYAVSEVTFLRFGCGAVIAAAALPVLRPGLPSRETLVAHGGRAFITVGAATSFFFALGQLPLAKALVLSFLSPMFLALFGALILGERVDGRIVLALVAGFANTLVVVSDQIDPAGGTRSLAGAAAALFSALCYALGQTLLRARAQRDPLIIIVVLQNLGPAVLLAPFAYAVWRMPTPGDFALFTVIGALGVSGHVLLTTAFARAEAARLAPLDYTSLIWAVTLGYIWFGEVPTLATIIGAALIIGGTLLASRR